LVLAAMMVTLSGSGGAGDPRGVLSEAGRAAFRAFGADMNVMLDIATADPRVLADRLSPRLGAIPPSRLDVPGWALIGARFVPGARSLAALVLWENRDRARVGLLIEPLDAPADSAPRARSLGGMSVSAWTEDGLGFVAIGRDATLGVRAERAVVP
jgi:anti-sigma factor RsiW